MYKLRKQQTLGDVLEKMMSFPVLKIEITVPIEEAYGYYLAEDIVSDSDVPSFDRSPYDGFAVRSEDCMHADSQAPVILMVVDKIGAENICNLQIKQCEAVRIMTGAKIPDGCDAIIKIESTRVFEENGNSYIEIRKSLKPGQNISFQGEDLKQGEKLLCVGSRITTGAVALLATFGYSEIKVYKKPVVGIVATGSELLEITEKLQAGKIRNSNSYMIGAEVIKCGAIARHYGIAQDTKEEIKSVVSKMMNEVDLVITTGGVSVGDFDYVPEVFEELGAEVLCNKIDIRPGSVTTIAHVNERGGKILIGLSGNPSASFVGAVLFAAPLIKKMLGNRQPFLKQVRAVLRENINKIDPITKLVRGVIWEEDCKLHVKPTGLDKSGAVSSIAYATALIILPPQTTGYVVGDVVDILLLESVEGSENFGHTVCGI